MATHQAKNLELLKTDSEWMRGRVESIDLFITQKLEESTASLKSIDEALWHIVKWIWAMFLLGLLVALFSLGGRP